MARVPVYSGPQAEAAPLPNARQNVAAPDAAFGSVQAQQLQQLGSMGQKVALEAKQEADRVSVLNADTEAERLESSLTYGEGGYTKVSAESIYGPDADRSQPFVNRFASQYDTGMNEIRGRLKNDAQRAAFDQLRSRRLVAFEGRLSAYDSQMITKYKVDTGKAAIDTAGDVILGAYNDPAKIAEALTRLRAGVTTLAEAQGWGGETTKSAMRLTESKAMAAAVDRALDNEQPELAANLLLKFGDLMTAEDKTKLEKPIADAGRDARAQSIFAETQMRGMSAEQAVDFVRSNHEGKDEEFFAKYVMQRFSEVDALREREQRRAADSAWQIVAHGGRPPQSLMRRLDGRDQVAIRKGLEDRAVGREAKTDNSTYYGLTMAAVNEPTKFMQEDLRRYADKLSPGDMRHFINMQADVGKPEKRAQIISNVTAINNRIRQVGLDPTGGKGAVLGALLSSQLVTAQDANGGRLDEKARDKVLDDAIRYQEIPGRVWGTKQVRAYAMTDAQKRAAVLAEAERRGIKPTEKQIDAAVAAWGKQ